MLDDRGGVVDDTSLVPTSVLSVGRVVIPVGTLIEGIPLGIEPVDVTACRSSISAEAVRKRDNNRLLSFDAKRAQGVATINTTSRRPNHPSSTGSTHIFRRLTRQMCHFNSVLAPRFKERRERRRYKKKASMSLIAVVRGF